VGTRPERRAKNEALLREVNERRAAIDRQAEGSWADPAELFEFVCECGIEECESRIQMTLDEYDAIRQQDDRFPIVPGHDSPDIETVVETHERYAVVDKKPEFERFVEEGPGAAPG
jgi:hypothetical protein